MNIVWRCVNADDGCSILMRRLYWAIRLLDESVSPTSFYSIIFSTTLYVLTVVECTIESRFADAPECDCE